MPVPVYTGRFAPSPTGPLHAGSVVAALASWLDARAHGGRWLVRIEDVDVHRCTPAAEEEILRQLDTLGLVPDEAPWRQAARSAAYDAAVDRLTRRGWAYPCGCSRRDVDEALAAVGAVHARQTERVYPGTCRLGLAGRTARAVRLLTGAPDGGSRVIAWHDRRLGAQQQDVTREVGDFILRRADGPHAYQLAVVVDDAEQGVTHVVRGQDLADNTPRQILLQRALGLPTPVYLHAPLVRGTDGLKLSKQNGARAVDTSEPVRALEEAARVLGLGVEAAPGLARARFLERCVQAWARSWGCAPAA
ncbi:MAG: tRNA glutamyl-Q(34) synthetase GluQRS [Rubrivivax sp.]